MQVESSLLPGQAGTKCGHSSCIKGFHPSHRIATSQAGLQTEHSGAAEAVLATLPDHTSSPVLWSSQDRAELLRGSPALHEAEQLEADVRGEWRSIASAAEASVPAFAGMAGMQPRMPDALINSIASPTCPLLQNSQTDQKEEAVIAQTRLGCQLSSLRSFAPFASLLS